MHRRARRPAHRQVAIGIVENDTLFGKAVHCRRLHKPVAISRQRRRGKLVGHDEKEIGFHFMQVRKMG